MKAESLSFGIVAIIKREEIRQRTCEMCIPLHALECNGLKSIPVLLTFIVSFAETPLNLEKSSMSNNIRNKAIFEIKIAKIAQSLP